jgi:hypothetical protein
MEVFSFGCLMNQTTDTPEEEMARITRVTAADVVRAAASFTADTLFFLNGTAFGDEEEDMDD